MSDWTYEIPDAETYLHTLRRYLEENSRKDIAGWLAGASCEIHPSSSYGIRLFSYQTSVYFSVPAQLVGKFTEAVKKVLVQACDAVMPSIAGYDITYVAIAPILEPPPHDSSSLKISRETRRNILDYLLLREMPYYGRQDLISFLNRVWNLSEMPSTDPRFSTAEGDIRQHMVNFRDWDDDYLFVSYLRLFECVGRVFLSFLELDFRQTRRAGRE